MAGEPDWQYVRARRVLLDALEALGDQRRAIVLVGAQAIYLRTGEADFAVSPFTTDADLAVAPELLLRAPVLAEAMNRGGFSSAEQGIWKNGDGVQVDLLVPKSVAGKIGRRSAPSSRRRTARMSPGGCRGSSRRWSIEPWSRSSLWTGRTHARSRSTWPDRLRSSSPSSTRSLSGSAQETPAASTTRTPWTCSGSFAGATVPSWLQRSQLWRATRWPVMQPSPASTIFETSSGRRLPPARGWRSVQQPRSRTPPSSPRRASLSPRTF